MLCCQIWSYTKKASPKTQGRLVGTIECSSWKFAIRSIVPASCPWDSEDEKKGWIQDFHQSLKGSSRQKLLYQKVNPFECSLWGALNPSPLRYSVIVCLKALELFHSICQINLSCMEGYSGYSESFFKYWCWLKPFKSMTRKIFFSKCPFFNCGAPNLIRFMEGSS